MTVRNRLLALYFSLAQRTTLRAMAQETGLQVSRIFRIMKQDNLKVDEWKRFSALICKKLGLEKDLIALAEECLSELARDDLQRILNFMERTLFYARIKTLPENDAEQTSSSTLPPPSPPTTSSSVSSSSSSSMISVVGRKIRKEERA